MRATEFQARPGAAPQGGTRGVGDPPGAAAKRAADAFQAAEDEHALVFRGDSAPPLRSRPGGRRPPPVLTLRCAHETSAPKDPLERLADRVVEHATRHGKDPERMLRLTYIELGRRCLLHLRRELEEAERDYPRRLRAERRAAAELAHACRTYDENGIARAREAHADAAERVPRAQRRVLRARALIEQWSAELHETALGLAKLEGSR